MVRIVRQDPKAVLGRVPGRKRVMRSNEKASDEFMEVRESGKRLETPSLLSPSL